MSPDFAMATAGIVDANVLRGRAAWGQDDWEAGKQAARQPAERMMGGAVMAPADFDRRVSSGRSPAVTTALSWKEATCCSAPWPACPPRKPGWTCPAWDRSTSSVRLCGASCVGEGTRTWCMWGPTACRSGSRLLRKARGNKKAASWCGPCAQTLSQIVRAVEKYQDRNVILLAVNLQETPKAINAMLARLNSKTTVALDRDGIVAGKCAATTNPQTVIIDVSGSVARLFVGEGPQYVDQVREALQAAVSPATGRGTSP